MKFNFLLAPPPSGLHSAMSLCLLMHSVIHAHAHTATYVQLSNSFATSVWACQKSSRFSQKSNYEPNTVGVSLDSEGMREKPCLIEGAGQLPGGFCLSFHFGLIYTTGISTKSS